MNYPRDIRKKEPKYLRRIYKILTKYYLKSNKSWDKHYIKVLKYYLIFKLIYLYICDVSRDLKDRFVVI